MAPTFVDQTPRVESVARLISAEFHEMPGMRLTSAQVRRLWNLSPRECDEVLEALQKQGLLVQDSAGRYVRRRFHH